MAIKIMSWNILADIWLNENQYRNIPLTFLNKHFRYNQNKEIIDQIDADIVLLQEVEYDIYLKFRDDYKDKYHVVELQYHGEKHWARSLAPHKKMQLHGNLIMIRNGLFKHLKIAKFQMSINGNMAGLIKFRHKQTNEKYIIANIHLDITESARIREINKLLEFLKKFMNNNKIIIGGDINSDLKNPAHKLFTSSGFHNIVADSLMKHKSENLSTYYCQGVMDDHIYCYNCDIIDGYIFDHLINKEEKKKKICETDQMKVFGSDHFPVIGIIH